MIETKETEFEGWALLELMGHRKLPGYVRPATVAGAGVIRIDIPKANAEMGSQEWTTTQYYSPNALYCLTPVSEEAARKLAKVYSPAPVSRYELEPPRNDRSEFEDEYEEDLD